MFSKKKLNDSVTTMQTTFFFEPQAGYEFLDDTDKKNARKIGAHNAGETLLQAPFPSAALTDYIYTNFRTAITDDQSKTFILKALRSYAEHPEVIDIILKHKPRPNEKNGLFNDSFNTIAADKNLHHLWLPFAAYQESIYDNDRKNLVTIACQYKLYDFLGDALSKLPRTESKSYFEILAAAGNDDNEYFRSFLALSNKFDKDLSSLNNLFVQAAKNNLVANAQALLAKGADANAKDGLALVYAAKNNNADFFNGLMPLINLEKYGSSILSNIKALSAYSLETIQPLQDAVTVFKLQAERQREEDARIAADKLRYGVPRSDILSDTLRLPSGITLTTLFNFESREKIIITENKTALDTVVISFNDLDPNAVENALDKLRERGGSASNDWMHKNNTKKITLDKN